jgi:tripartite-type tricarboxylate transporter receptor subunit TctC
MTLRAVAAMLALALAAPAIAQQPYPSRLIKIVVPVSVGAGADLVARIFAPRMSERMGVPVIVENLPAGGGHIGISTTARAPADGYTLLMAPTSYALQPVLNKSVAYDALTSYAAVGLVATGSMVLAVSQTTPAKSLREFIALAKAQPGALTYGSPGNGTPQHLAMELFKLDASLDLLHIPYKEAAGAGKDLAAGQINAAILTASSAAPLAQTGRVLVLANLGDVRSGMFSGQPLLKEEGFPSMGVGVWVGMMVPAATPPDVVRKLNDEMNALLDVAEVKEQISKLGLVPVGGPPERLTTLVRRDFDGWTRAVTAAKIKMD